MTLRYVEDYLEFLYGTMDKEGNSSSTFSYPSYNSSSIKLATYDKSPISSMGNFCAKARTEKLESCLTDRQVDLARKIIFKYRRQFLSLNIVLPPNESDLELRHSVRKIDRSKFLKFDESNKQAVLKFPYDPKKVSELHEYSNVSAGLCEWNNTDRTWTFDLTEGNLLKVLTLFKDEDLKFDDALSPHVVDILSATPESLPTLTLNDGRMQLDNCHARVHEYLETIDWNPNDVARLAYWASQMPALGINIAPVVQDVLMAAYDHEVVNIILNKKVTMPSNNMPDGPWYNALLNANHELQDYPWVLHLSWWTTKTDWSPFKNMIEYKERDKNSFRVSKPFADLLLGQKDPIVVVDSVIGRDAVRNFIENNSLKVIYISDIGQT